jgi:tetratricopeptide (TPR) repeat protein
MVSAALSDPARDAAARAHCARAVALLAACRSDPHAEVAQALALSPRLPYAYCVRAGLAVCAGDDAPAGMLEAALADAAALATQASAGERAHLAAAQAWLAHDHEQALACYRALCERAPRDLLALVVAHAAHLALGRAVPLRDLPRRALAAWTPSMPGYADVLGLLAFGLEETGNLAAARSIAQQALRADRHNARAIHAMAHVFEMQGRHAEGLAWLAAHPLPSDVTTGYRVHLDWHRGLFELGRGDTDAALRVFDTHISAARPARVSMLADAANLLWRLRLAGIHAGRRWRLLARGWERAARHARRPFNLLHAVAAFVGSARTWTARALRSRLRAGCGAHPHDAASQVAFAAGEALAAYGRRDYRHAANLLVGLPPDADPLGGSRVQRNLLRMTLQAALRRMRTRHPAPSRKAEPLPAARDAMALRKAARA